MAMKKAWCIQAQRSLISQPFVWKESHHFLDCIVFFLLLELGTKSEKNEALFFWFNARAKFDMISLFTLLKAPPQVC